MTRKDYIKIAEIMRGARECENFSEPMWTHILNGLTRVLIDDNPRFSLERFEQAAG